MAHVSSQVLWLLPFILIHGVLARQGILVDSDSALAMSAKTVEDGGKKYQAKPPESAGLGICRSEPINPKDSGALLPIKSSLGTESHLSSGSRSIRSRETHKRLDAKRLLEEAAEELVRFMHKDYKGFNSPSSKPPIHNRFPRH